MCYFSDVQPACEKRCTFELFKSNVCHRLNRLGDINFLIDVLENNEIESFLEKKWFPECLYLLAMVDYISRLNGVDICQDYNGLRLQRLPEPLYPAGVLTLAAALNNDAPKLHALENAIPEFLRFNIVESEVRNVV